MEKRNVIVIGAGIAGMTAAIYLKRFNIDVLVIEKEIPGGQLNKMPNLKNYPGFLENDGAILAGKIYGQLKELDIEYRNEDVIEIKTSDKQIITKNNIYEYDQLIIATGRRPRLLNAPGEKDLIGHGISYCAICDGFFFKGKDVAVIGGSRTALENAIYLSKLVNKCYIICRKPYLKGEDINIAKVESLENVEIVYNANVKKFVGSEVLESIVIDIEGKEKSINLSGAFISIGYEPNSDFNTDRELKLNNGYIVVNKNYETNIDDIFAIGDIINKELYQLTTAVAEASIVASYIKKEYYK